MRILYATHFYPPEPCGGAGYYTATLAESFRQAGHETRVVCIGRWQAGAQHYNGSSDDVQAGVPVRRFHLNWRRAPAPFDYLSDNPALDEPLQAYLREYRPQVVHVTSCYTLSARAIQTFKAAGLPIVVHLVDFWFICPLHTLLRKNGQICYGGKDAWDCQSCLLSGTKVDRLTRAVLPERLRARLLLGLGRRPVVTRQPGVVGLLGDMARRRRYTLARLCQADVILAPSQTLLELYVRNGLPRDRVQLLPYGHDVGWAEQVKRQPAPQLRVGFLGNVLPIKGVHVLVEAFGRLAAAGKARLDIYGDDTLEAAYTARLKSHSAANICWHGRYQRDQLASILSGLDVVVVPSVWHENNPLVIQESFAAGCPVIASDLGGMAEFVLDGVNGLQFRANEAAQLARQIQRLIEAPELLAQLRSNLPAVRTMAQEQAELKMIYADLIQ